MKSSLKVFLTVASVAVLAVALAPAAKAQCVPAQQFASIGQAKAGETQVDIDVVTAGAENAGNEIGRFWASSNSNNANSFLNPAQDCPSTEPADTQSSWWILTMTGTRGIAGFIGGGGAIDPCNATSCPSTSADNLVLVVEDYIPGPPPGAGGNAGFIALEVDATTADPRIWNYARTQNNPGTNNNNGLSNQTYPFIPFPLAFVTNSQRQGGSNDVDLIVDLADVAPNYHGATSPPANNPIPPQTRMMTYDICTFHGPSDPGRDRSLWNCSPGPAYTGGPAVGVPYKALCPTPTDDTWVAIGLTFSGGAGPAVQSSLVGRAIAVECDPTIADPEPEARPGIRPKRPARAESRR